MKKAVTAILWTVLVLTVLFPLCTIVCAHFGYVFRLASVPVFSCVLVLLSVCAVVLSFACMAGGKTLSVLSVLFTPLSLVNALFCVLESRHLFVLINVCLVVVCGFILTAKYVKPLVMKAIALSVSATLAHPMLCLCILILTFGNFGCNTVVQTIESPDGQHYVQVIDSDQGALGGATFIDVYESSTFDALLFTIQKERDRIYVGEWREYEFIEIEWVDADTVRLNGCEYDIN